MINFLENHDIKLEIDNALRARQSGFEGKSRVSARRVAGLAILSFYNTRGLDIQTSNLFTAIEKFVTDKSIPPLLTFTASHFLERVNSNYQISSNVDLIEQAIILCKELEQLNMDWSNNGK